MSGIFLNVWAKGDKYDKVLKSTKGGSPHITIVYTGKNLSRDKLKNLAIETFHKLVTTKDVILTRAYVNSFELSDGKMRHDCLIHIDDDTKARILEYRGSVIVNKYPEISKKFSMNNPHVTVGVHWTEKDAQNQVDTLNNSGLLPYPVSIVGVNI